MIKHLCCNAMITAFIAATADASGINGWVTDAYVATYEGPETESGSAHLPAYVRAIVDETHIAVVVWDIKTSNREDGLLSMLLSTTWESPMEPWQGSSEWFVSSFQIPMADGSSWSLLYRMAPGVFELGAPPFLDPMTLPQHQATDNLQRHWSFSQSFLIIPESHTLTMLAGGIASWFLRLR